MLYQRFPSLPEVIKESTFTWFGNPTHPCLNDETSCPGDTFIEATAADNDILLQNSALFGESIIQFQQDYNFLYTTRDNESYMLVFTDYEGFGFLLKKIEATWSQIAKTEKTFSNRWDGSCNIRDDKTLECILAASASINIEGLYYFSYGKDGFQEYTLDTSFEYGDMMELAPAGITGPDDSFMIFANPHSGDPSCPSPKSNCDIEFMVKWYKRTGDSYNFESWDFTEKAKPLYDELLPDIEGFEPWGKFDANLTNRVTMAKDTCNRYFAATSTRFYPWIEYIPGKYHHSMMFLHVFRDGEYHIELHPEVESISVKNHLFIDKDQTMHLFYLQDPDMTSPEVLMKNYDTQIIHAVRKCVEYY